MNLNTISFPLVGKANKVASKKRKRMNKEREKNSSPSQKEQNPTPNLLINAQRKKWKVGCLLLHKSFPKSWVLKTKNYQ
jgi:hypothetical protein